MRTGYRAFALASLVSLAACGGEGDATFNPMTPDPTKAYVRVINATNDTLDFAGANGIYAGTNLSITPGNSRCLEGGAAFPITIRNGGNDVNTELPATTAQTSTFAVGNSYSLIVYKTGTTAAAPYAYASWKSAGDFTAPVDSAGLRFFNASPTASGTSTIDVYANLPGDPEPALTATTVRKTVTALPVGSLSAYYPVPATTSYQARVTRGGSNTTIVNSTTTVLNGEETTWVIGLVPGGGSAVRSFTTGGC